MIGELLILILLWLFDSTIRHYILIFSKFLSDDNNEPLQPLPVNKKTTQENDIALLPEIFEFEAVEDVKDGEETFYQRKAIQKAICLLTDGGETEPDVKKWQFICKVCNKAFDSVDLCEEHISKNDHTFMSSEEVEDEDFDMLRIQLETLRKMNGVECNGDEKEKLTNGVEDHKPRNYDRQYNQDFIPIYFGKWSQVICELRHRFGQACHGDCKHDNLGLSETRTFPEALERTIDGVYERLANECLVHSSCPQNPASEPQNPTSDSKTVIPEASLLKFGTLPNSLKCALDELYQKSVPQSERRACPKSLAIKNRDQEAMLRSDQDHDAVAKDCKNSSTETEISELTVPSDTDQSKEKATTEEGSRPSSTSSGAANCQIEKVKVCVDFVTRLLYCESCFMTFNTIEQAFAHFKTDGDSDKSADQYTWDEYDVLHQMNRSNDKLQGLSDNGPNGCEMEMAGMNHDVQETKDKVLENFAEEGGQEEDEEAQAPNENHPQECSDTLQSPSKLDSENQNENDSLDSYSEKMPLFESFSDKGKQKRKKKKKKKAWRMLKRSVMYAIIFFF